MILVTGSAGHLGEALIRSLKASGKAVRGLDIKASPWTDVVGSVSDSELISEAMGGVTAILHTATLHKPHVATHPARAFVDTNVTGTLTLLEAAKAAGVPMIFTSTTSAFGAAMRPPADAPAAWIDESVTPVPRNIYGVTKVAAEDLCHLFHLRHDLPVLVLRTSRFFPEEDDNRGTRETYPGDNAKMNEMTFRRIDIEDVVSAHLLALDRVAQIGFDRFVLSATTPFRRPDLPELRRDAVAVLARTIPAYVGAYEALGWQMFPSIDRVYDNTHARERLGWTPKHSFETTLARIASGGGFASPMALAIGCKGYHEEVFEDGPFPVND